MWPTQYDARDRVYADCGSEEHDIYTPVYAADGSLELDCTGTENIYRRIQSHKDSVDINVLLSRYIDGDTAVLSRVQGAYGDFTGLPSTYADMLNQIAMYEQEFYTLPVDVRAKFAHDPNVFLASVGSPDFFERLGVKSEPIEPISDKEVV